MDAVLYRVLGVQEAQTDTVLYTVWGSERVLMPGERVRSTGM